MFEKILMSIRSIFQTDKADAEMSAALDERAHGLAWRTSIVDLLEVLKLDSSLPARRRLAQELGYAIEFTGDTKDNEWLHERVMDEVAKHGIKIPK